MKKKSYGEKVDFIVLSRLMAQVWKPDESPAILISINDVEDDVENNPTKFIHEDCYLDILRLTFSDCDREFPDYDKPIKLMNKLHAKQILEFVEKYINDVSLIVVHCAAGVSRSAGVAAALSLLIEGNEGLYYSGREYHPNIHVKTLIIRYALENNYLV
jgi:predicted protein tyrosine phosphatase